MGRLTRLLRSNVLFETLVIVWVMASPLAIQEWVRGFEEPVAWAAFIAGVLGVLVGWLAVAPYQTGRQAARRPGPAA
jgi:hypothetical protein